MISHHSYNLHISHKFDETPKAYMSLRTLGVLTLMFFASILHSIFPTFNFQFGALRAQDITVTVTPTQPILPPQVMLYITEPANYFNVTLTNTGKDDANVYLVMQVEQVNPFSGLSLSTPPRRQPKLPIVVSAGSTRILAPVEIRSLFNHIPLNEITAPEGLFDNYTNGSFGLLPEGQYELHMTAYRWDPSLPSPVVASSPSGGLAMFSVCYNAQAPQFLTPMATSNELLSVAELNPMTPQFTWLAPVVACNPNIIQYTYSFRVVQVLPGQMPDQAMDYNPVVYQASNLSTPMCMIPQTVIKQMTEGATYAAQVTANTTNFNRTMLNYVNIANEGKSPYKLFRLNAKVEPVNPIIDHGDDDDDDDGKDDTPIVPEDESVINIAFGDTQTSDLIEDSLYTFSNPIIREPKFLDENGARKRFTEADLEVSWDASNFMGGEGHQSDTIEIEYELQFFDNKKYTEMEEVLEQEPFYTIKTKELKHTITWDDIKDDVEAGDYMLLRILPVVKKGHSVGFTGNDNVVDFALAQRLSQQYFQCEAQVEINDKTPTTKDASEFKGKVVAIGEYNLTVDEIKGSGDSGFSGTGRVEWNPFGSKIMVCVKFDKLMINSEDIVYEGVCETVAAPEMLSSMEVVDKLFSTWGLDNLISDTGIPFANELQNKATAEVKSLAERIDLGTYYKKLQDGKDLYNLLTTGSMDKLYFPVRFPKDILPDDFNAVDIQIVDMKFSPTYATMNVLGQATLPECDVLKSKILIFGAPRLCISPDSFLPEGGQIALLGDFTLTPSPDIEMTFKAPKDVLEPKDGCYISWKTVQDTTKLELLGVDIDMKIEGIVKDDHGKATDERPIINLKASVGSWDDLLVDRVSIEDFQVKDLPGWTFKASDIVYDHSRTRNSEHMGEFPHDYDKEKAGMKINGVLDDLYWEGLHIGTVGVGFPKSLELGDVGDNGDKRLWIDAKEMYWDQSGVTVKLSAENVFAAKEGTLGGWGISLDEAHVQIIQNDFDNAGFSGQINIPILKSAKKDDDQGGNERFGNVNYSCRIRNLTSPEKRNKGERSRYSYIFLTEQVEELDFSFLVAKAKFDTLQTYFLVEAYDDEKVEDKINTQVELCLGGEIGIGLVDDANEWLKEKTSSLPLELKIPDIHFTKMRLSNVKRNEWTSNDKRVKDKRKAREDQEDKIHKAALKILMESEEMNIGTAEEPFYFDLGEWSLASAKKYLGPFSFNLDKFSPNYTDGKVTLELGGSVGLVEDKINVGAAVVISAKVNTEGDIKDWSIDDGDVQFKKLSLDLDFTAVHLKGELEASEKPDKGYSGTLDIGITGFFNLDCKGGYYEHKKAEDDNNDTNYSWGYFMADLETAALRFDPVVIDRISGGFFFNCRPTKGTKKFNGTPQAQNGVIGIAFGLGISSSAGKETMNADLDMLVVYDSTNDCFSTFMLNGNLQAVGGLVKADCSLIYENEKNDAGKTRNRYLCLNLTVEAGADSKALLEKVTKANSALEALQNKMNDFQASLDPKELYQKVLNPQSGLNRISGDYKKNKDGEAPDKDETELTAEEKKEQEKKKGEALKTKITLELKVTWVKDGTTYDPPKWHLYVGEPTKDKRCFFQFLKYDGSIVQVDIGADAYLCIGNELPNGGVLPPIPPTISEFLSGHDSKTTDMGADLNKAERSRKAAAKKLLDPDSCEGGIMVGASAWGRIDIDLGLLYGGIEAIAGFDASLVHYGNNAFCVNSGSAMGYKGWYAMGQLYAYLAAHFGIHIHIGALINEKIEIFNAGIGGVLELGLPNPTWVEGQARIKISLLGGLCKINKKFEFSAGNHCVPFKGNALDGFELFQGVSHGSDSLEQALFDPTFAVSLNEAKNMTFTTQSSIGSHYRLLDPSWESELQDKEETTEDEIEKSMALNASRTYVFDINQDKDQNGNKMGVRLFDLGEGPTFYMSEDFRKMYGSWQPIEAMKKNSDSPTLEPYNNDMAKWAAQNLTDRSLTVGETSVKMMSSDINSGPISLTNKKGNIVGGRSIYLNKNGVLNVFDNTVNEYNKTGESWSVAAATEVNCTFREEKGSTFHLSNMDVKPGHSYMLVLSADAYEIRNGRRYWCEYYSEKDKENYNIHWQQQKAWFFRIKSEEEEHIVVDSLRDLEPYVALAYPSTNGTRVRDTRGEGAVKAYFSDIMHPTIALNRDIRSSLPLDKMEWVLTGTTADGTTVQQTRKAVYKQDGNCINLEPEQAFTEFSEFIAARNQDKNNYNFDNEQYHLQLLYTYFHKKKERALVPNYDKNGKYISMVWGYEIVDDKDSTFALVDLNLTPLPHHLAEKQVDGERYQSDNWMMTTSRNQTKPVAYSLPFVGATIDAAPTIEYENKYFDNNGNELLTDAALVFLDNDNKYKGLPYRLIDPYLYFAYLGKWVFIGDREINEYGFDNVPVKFGSESLVFNYNGTNVNCEFLKDKKNKSLLQLRNQMYGVWNTWNYNDSNQPKYPLPSVGSAIGGVTAANQDGKASTVTPLNINHFSDYTHVFEDLVKDYMGAYTVADKLCNELRKKTEILVSYFYQEANYYGSFSSDSFDKDLNEDMKKWNSTHRGQYLECSDRGYSVRVPYYQLPLIFGDCFGEDAKYDGYSLNRASRTFSTSIGGNDMVSGDPPLYNLQLRFPSAASEMLFFRLNEGGTGTKSYVGYTGKPFGHNPSVPYDKFDVHKALEYVSNFQARIYRVDCYDIQTGQYIVSPNKSFGGGPWEHKVTIGAGNATASNLDQMYEANEEKNEYLTNHFDKPMPQAVWCEDKNTLIFVVSEIDYNNADGQKIGDVTTSVVHTFTVPGIERISQRRWASMAKANCTRVVIDPSFKDADITSCESWFSGFSKLKSIEGLANMPSNITSTVNMFRNCSALTSINLKGFDFSKVSNMACMFQGCTSLGSINFDNCKANKLTTMFYMFEGCENLTTASLMNMEIDSLGETSHMFENCRRLARVDLTGLKTDKVEEMSYMFKNCESLTNLNLSSFSGNAVRRMEEMFMGCSQLSSLDLSNFDPKGREKDPSMARLFAGCRSLRTLHIDILNPVMTYQYPSLAMFDEVTDKLTCYYFCDLTPYIADQIPGTKKPLPDNRAKVIHGREKDGKEALFFLYSNTTFRRNETYDLSISITDSKGSTQKTDHRVTVLNVWSGDDIFNTGNTKPKWAATSSIASAVRNVYIDDSFAATPTSTYAWFMNFDKITEVLGLTNLKTNKVTNMGSMFYGCTNLRTINFTDADLDAVTNMNSFCYNCTELSEVHGISGNLPNVTSMSYMFYHCENLTSPINGGQSVTTMKYMYAGCTSIENKSGTFKIVTDKVTNMMGMFHGCSNLRKTFNFSSTANVTDMSYLYANCESLREVNMGTLNTEKVRNMTEIFSGCNNVYQIDVGEMSSKSLTSCSNMFKGVPRSCTIYIAYDANRIIDVCPKSDYPNRILVYPASVVVLRSGGDYKLHFVGEKITLKQGDKYNRYPYSGYDVQIVYSGTFVQNRVRSGANVGQSYQEMWNRFADRVVEVTIDDSFKKIQLINAYGYFKGMNRLTAIKGIGNLTTKYAKDLGSFFSGCSSLTTIQGSAISTASATRLDNMFKNCAKLTTVNSVQFASSDVAYDMNHMFAGCSSLEDINTNNYPHTGKATDLSYMFYGCSSLTHVPFINMNTESAEEMTSMFEGCSSLTDFKDISHFNVDNCWQFANMFKDCSQMYELDLSTWNWSSYSSRVIDGMFSGCKALRKLTLGSNFKFNNCQYNGNSSKSVFSNVRDLSVMVPAENLEDVKNRLTNYYGFIIGTTGRFYDANATETAQVLWSPTNKTITFYYGMPFEVGNNFNGVRVEKVWSGNAVLSNNSDTPQWGSTVQSSATTVVFDNSFINAQPTTTRAWFSNCRKLNTIKGIENLNTSKVTNMSRMFMNCDHLTSIELKHPAFTTSNVTDMSSMFSGCDALTSLNLSSFTDTRKVQNISSMFNNCRKVSELDLSKFSTASVTSANSLFAYCYALKKLKVGSGFTFSSMSNKAYAFSGVSKMEILATDAVLNIVKTPIKNKLGFIEKPDDTNGEFVATDKMSLQAIWCANNKTLVFMYGKEYQAGRKFNGYTITNVWKFGNTTPWLETVKNQVTTVEFDKSLADRSVTYCSEWFKDCYKLTTVRNINNLKTPYCTTFSYMFSGCSSLSNLDVSNLDVSNANSLYSMFYGCSKLTSLDVSKWKTSKVTNMGYLFTGCKLNSIDLTNFDVSNVKIFKHMFSGCRNLTTIKGLDKWNTVSATDMSCMFNNCESLTTFDPSKFNTVSVTNMSYMFYGCESWVVNAYSTPINKYNVSNVTNMSYMFAYCSNIFRMKLPDWNTGKVTDMSSMFAHCTALKEIKLTGWDTRKVTTMEGMFYGCTKLPNIDLSSFNTLALTSMRNMFRDCSNLGNVNLSSFDLSRITDMSYMFCGCKGGLVIDFRIPKKMKAGVNMQGMFNDTWNDSRDYGGFYLNVNPNFQVTTRQYINYPSKSDFFNSCTFELYTNDRSVNPTTKNNAITTLKNLGWKGSHAGEKPEFIYRYANGGRVYIEY